MFLFRDSKHFSMASFTLMIACCLRWFNTSVIYHGIDSFHCFYAVNIYLGYLWSLLEAFANPCRDQLRLTVDLNAVFLQTWRRTLTPSDGLKLNALPTAQRMVAGRCSMALSASIPCLLRLPSMRERLRKVSFRLNLLLLLVQPFDLRHRRLYLFWFLWHAMLRLIVRPLQHPERRGLLILIQLLHLTKMLSDTTSQMYRLLPGLLLILFQLFLFLVSRWCRTAQPSRRGFLLLCSSSLIGFLSNSPVLADIIPIFFEIYLVFRIRTASVFIFLL